MYQLFRSRTVNPTILVHLGHRKTSSELIYLEQLLTTSNIESEGDPASDIGKYLIALVRLVRLVRHQ